MSSKLSVVDPNAGASSRRRRGAVTGADLQIEYVTVVSPGPR